VVAATALAAPLACSHCHMHVGSIADVNTALIEAGQVAAALDGSDSDEDVRQLSQGVEEDLDLGSDEGSSADERENEQDREFIDDGSSESGSGSEAEDAAMEEDAPPQMTPELIRANHEEHRERLAE
jgi:hypothetical protein